MRAFDGCTALTSAVIPDSVSTIGDYAFNNCTSLETAEIGNGVTSIGNWAFLNNTALTRVMFRGDAPVVAAGTFNNTSPVMYHRFAASDWESEFAGHPTAIWPEVLHMDRAADQFTLHLVASDEQDVVVQQTPYLPGAIWTSVSTNTMTGAPVEVTFADPEIHPLAVFRAVLQE